MDVAQCKSNPFAFLPGLSSDILVSCDLDQWYIAIGKVDQVRADRRDFHGRTSPQQEDMMLVLKPEDHLTACCSKSLFLSPVRTAWKSRLRAANDATTCSMNASQHRQRLDHATALAECSAVCSRLIVLGTQVNHRYTISTRAAFCNRRSVVYENRSC